MPVFAYRARTGAGRAEHGIVDAESLRGAWQQLRARGVFPTELAASHPGRTAGGRVELAELAAATRQRTFPALYRELVRAGEASGALAAVLDRLACDGAAAVARRARLRAALFYPIVMLATTSLVLTFLLVWVVPQV